MFAQHFNGTWLLPLERGCADRNTAASAETRSGRIGFSASRAIDLLWLESRSVKRGHRERSCEGLKSGVAAIAAKLNASGKSRMALSTDYNLVRDRLGAGTTGEAATARW